MSNTTFKPGQSVTVADGTRHTVARIHFRPGEVTRLETEGGPEWLATDCSLAPAPEPSSLVLCEDHQGAHREIPGCVWPHYLAPAGAGAPLGPSDHCTD